MKMTTNAHRSPTARAVALDLARAVLDRRQSLDEAIEANSDIVALSSRDRAYARLLIATLLRRLGQIDDAIGRCLERPLTPRAKSVLHILRLGATQLLFLDTPAHAAVDSTVALATGRLSAYRSLVNAVLRRLAREGRSIVASQDAAPLNLPAWLWQSWTNAYGEDATRAAARVLASEPPLDITVKADAEEWAKRLDAQILPNGSLRRPGIGLVTELPGYAEGAWWVQDAAAALPATLLGDVRGETVIDLCAAPGGKAAQLAASGGRVIAVDASPARIARLKANLDRLRLEGTPVAADAISWRPPTPARFVLLDAPCSATGTIRRHPDAAWLKTPADVGRLMLLQDRLLAAAVEMLAPGGRLVFCTCSLQPEEGPERITALLSSGAPVAREPIQAHEVGGVEAFITPEGDMRTLPGHLAELGGVDGFYAARLVRVR